MDNSSINNETKNEEIVKLSNIEKLQCLKEINDKLKKILYVYEKSQEPDSNYNYKVFCSGLIIFISSSNILFDGELVSVVVNINSILTNDFDKKEIKRITFESINFINHLQSKYKIRLMKIDKENNTKSKEGANNGSD